MAAFLISIHALLAESDPFLTFYFLCIENFYPRSPCGERLLQRSADCNCRNISIHALLAESDGSNQAIISQTNDFYPRSPCGERRLIASNATTNYEFLSTLSLRRATMVSVNEVTYQRHFYPRSPCGERPPPAPQGKSTNKISIHALLAESDSKSAQNSRALLRI